MQLLLQFQDYTYPLVNIMANYYTGLDSVSLGDLNY